MEVLNYVTGSRSLKKGSPWVGKRIAEDFRDFYKSKDEGEFLGFYCVAWKNWVVLEEVATSPVENLDFERPLFEWLNPQKSTSVTFKTECVIAQLLEQGIVISNDNEVRDYLFQHTDLSDLVLSIGLRAKEVFGPEPDTQLVLELERDSEFGYEHLNLLVRLKEYCDNFWNEVEEISTEFDYEIAGKSGWILITTDYRRPQ